MFPDINEKKGAICSADNNEIIIDAHDAFDWGGEIKAVCSWPPELFFTIIMSKQGTVNLNLAMTSGILPNDQDCSVTYEPIEGKKVVFWSM